MFALVIKIQAARSKCHLESGGSRFDAPAFDDFQYNISIAKIQAILNSFLIPFHKYCLFPHFKRCRKGAVAKMEVELYVYDASKVPWIEDRHMYEPC